MNRAHNCSPWLSRLFRRRSQQKATLQRANREAAPQLQLELLEPRQLLAIDGPLFSLGSFGPGVIDLLAQDAGAQIQQALFAAARPTEPLRLGLDYSPTANDDNFTTDEDTLLSGNVLANDSDRGGQSISAVAGTISTELGLEIALAADGTFTYDPLQNPAFQALLPTDSPAIDRFTYTVVDESGKQSTGQVEIEIFGVNDAPTVDDATATTTEDEPVTINVLALVTDPDHSIDDLSVTLPATLPEGITTVNANNEIVFDPNGDFETLAQGESAEITIEFTVSDGLAITPGTVTLTVTGVNDAPILTPLTATTTEDESLTLSVLPTVSDVDTPASNLTVNVPASLPQGSVSVTADQEIVFDPGQDFQDLGENDSAEVEFTYTVSDGFASVASTVTITITGVNDAPIAEDVAIEVQETAPLVYSLVDDDTDVDHPVSALTVEIDTSNLPAGLVTLQADQQIAIDASEAYFNLAFGETAEFTFGYTVSDGSLSDSGIVTVTVTGVDTADEEVPITDISVWNTATADPTFSDFTRSDVAAAIDGDLSTFSYLTTSPPYQYAMRAAFELESPSTINRLRINKFADVDNTSSDGTDRTDYVDLYLYYTTDTGPMALREWHRVSGLVNGYQGNELVTANAVDAFNGKIDDDSHEGWYSVTFDEVQGATAFSLRFFEDKPVDNPSQLTISHYRVREVELYQDTTQRNLTSVEAFYDTGLRIMNRPGQSNVIDGNLATESYITMSGTREPVLMTFDFSGVQELNRLRVNRFGNIDGSVQGTRWPVDLGARDSADLQFLYTTDSGPLDLRTWQPVTGLTNGYFGQELADVYQVLPSQAILNDERTEGIYSVSFDRVEATGFAIYYQKDIYDENLATHYRSYEIEAYNDNTQQVITEIDVFAQQGKRHISNRNNAGAGNADSQAIIDGNLGTSTYMTQPLSFGRHLLSLEMIQPQTVDTIRINKFGNIGVGDSNRLDYVVMYTTDTGPLNFRTWHRVTGLAGSPTEPPTAGTINPDIAFVDDDTHEGWFALNFDSVEATAIGLWFEQDPGESAEAYFRSREMELYNQAARRTIFNVQVMEWNPLLQSRADRPSSQNFVPSEAIDGDPNTYSFMTASGSSGSDVTVLELGSLTAVERLQITRNGNIDNTAPLGSGPPEFTNLDFFYTTDTGPVDWRDWHPLDTLNSGFNGSELVDGLLIGSEGRIVNQGAERDHTFSVTFDRTEMTAIAFRFTRSPTDPGTVNHFPAREINVYQTGP